MTSSRSPEILGTWGAVLLPLNADGSIDYVALTAHVEAMLDAELDGLYTNGTAGEFHTQTESEFDLISALVADRCTRRGVPFQLGACHMSAQLSRERLLRTKALGPVAFQVILPDWVPVSPVEAERFLAQMAEWADPIKLVLYNPRHAKRSLDLATIAALRHSIPGLVGVKTPDGDASWYETMRRLLPGFSVFVPGHHLATGWSLGASGSYSNVACLQPRGARAWQMLMKSDGPASLEFEERLLTFFEMNVAPLAAAGLSSVAVDKALCAAGSWCPMPSRVRWPYQNLDDEAVRRLRTAAHEALPELWN